MNTKICTKCKEDKPLEKFAKHKRKPGKSSWCKACIREYGKKYRDCPEKRERIILKQKKWRESNRLRCKKSNSETYLKSRKELSDHYIKLLLSDSGSEFNLLYRDITPELINLKRKQLKLKRDVKERK